MVFVKNDTVPVDRVNDLVFGFDAARFVFAQHILKRSEPDERPCFVDFRHIAGGNEAPPFEIDVRFQIRFPRVFDGGLERQDKDFFPPHFFGELIGGERFAETHFRVPEEMRRFARFFAGKVFKISGGRFNGGALFGTQQKSFRAFQIDGRTAAFKSCHCRFQFGQSDFIPFAAQMFDKVLFDKPVEIVVEEQSAVVAHGVRFENDFGGLFDRL